MGLLDILNSEQGRLGIGLLAAAGPRPESVGFGDRMQEALSGMDAYKQKTLQQNMIEQQIAQHKMQTEEMQRKFDQQKYLENLAPQFARPAIPGSGAQNASLDALLPPEMRTGLQNTPQGMTTPAKPASFDMPGYIGAVMGKYPLEAMNMQAKARAANEVTLKADERVLDRSTQKTLFSNVKHEKPPSAIQEYEFAVGQGETKNFSDWMAAQKRAGATSVSMKTDVKTGEGLAKEIGPMIAGSKAAAEGAINQMATASRLDDAINSGKLISGPFANPRIKLAQIGQILGVGGKDTDEVLRNTRETIQGLSKFSLEGRSSLKGQGQISDYEGKLLAKATSGDIEDLTIPELKVIVGAAKRVSKAQYDTHQRNMSVMRSKPELKDVADFYAVPDFPKTGGWSIQKE